MRVPQKIYNKITLWYNYALQMWPLVLEDWEKPHSIMGSLGKTSAWALFEENTILFDENFYLKNENDFLTDTVGHEMAHLITYQVYGDIAISDPHGEKWVSVMRKMGLEPNIFHDFDDSHVAEGEDFFCFCGQEGCQLCKKTLDSLECCAKITTSSKT